MKKIVKNVLVIALVMMAAHSFAQGGRAEKGKAKMEAMASELDLSADQLEKVKAILKEERADRKENSVERAEMDQLSSEEKRVLMAKRRLNRAETNKAINTRLEEVLTADQMAKYRAMKKQEMAKRKEFREERRDNKPQHPDMHQKEPGTDG